MSGPDQVQNSEETTGHDYKEQGQQQNQSRIKISNLLCSIETAEQKQPTWVSKTTSVDLEEPSYSQSSQSSLTDRSHRSEYSYSNRRSESQSYPPVQPTHNQSHRGNHEGDHTRSTYGSNNVHHDNYTHPSINVSSPRDLRDSRLNIEPSERRDSGLGRRDAEARDPGYSRYDHHGPSEWDHLPRGAPREHAPSYTTPPSAPSALGHFTPRSTPSEQRSVQAHSDYFRDPHEMDKANLKSGRSNSDFALHQQNYGPYLDASPTLPPAPILQTRQPSPRHDKYPQSSALPSPREMNTSSSYNEHLPSPTEHNRSTYQQSHTPRRSFQGDARRTSQGVVLPSPDSLYNSRKPGRIYGLDAADAPVRPPLAPSAGFGAKSLHDIPDELETEYSRRASTHHSDQAYRQNREPSIQYSQRSYDTHSTGPNSSYPSYRNDGMDRPQYEYSTHDDSRRPSAAPSSTSYSHNHPEYTRHSPGSDVQPPIWYQQYAHYKSHTRSSLSHGDSHAYSAHGRRDSDYASRSTNQPQRPHSPEQWRSRSSFSNGVPSVVSGEDFNNSKVASNRSRMSTSYSVHPFDDTIDQTSSSPSAIGKRDRGQEDDPFIAEDGVKAKRKRANADQLSVLNAAFERSYFPSTEERLRLSKQTKMCPRTVQIWFQNKRQSVKARTEAMDVAVAAAGAGRRRGSLALNRSRDEHDDNNQQIRGRDEGLDSQEDAHRKRRQSPLGQTTPYTGEKRRRSGPSMSSESTVDSLRIHPEDSNDDLFSRKRRATIAQMEQREY
ncbi:hypothetical protein BGZ76_007155 [Entomortierella beljakovae]|nr:hypothetical protein BGZ76_007155 [Entomortierella beljakovae]